MISILFFLALQLLGTPGVQKEQDTSIQSQQKRAIDGGWDDTDSRMTAY